MRLGVAGFPGVGKTVVFHAMAGGAAAGARPDPTRVQRTTIKVPDARLDAVAGVYRPRKKTRAEITVIDVPGAGGPQAHVLSPQLLNQMREADAFALVVRGWPGPGLPPPDPARELRDFEAELIISDLAVVERRLERLAKEGRSAPDRERACLMACAAALGDEVPLRRAGLAAGDVALLAGFGLLTLKPVLVICNAAEPDAAAPLPPALSAELKQRDLLGLVLSAPLEAELAALEPEDRAAFLADLHLAGTARERLIAACYRLLDLVSFFTGGGEEVRAWPVRRGTTALHAAGKVHTDMERGFIRAEVVSWADLVRLGSEARCREEARLRIEGKEYVVQDGDVIRFRFHV